MRNRIKTALKYRKTSLKTVAKNLGMSYTGLSRKGDYKALKMICDHLGLTTVVLIVDPKSGDIV